MAIQRRGNLLIPKLIQTEAENQAALARLDEIFDAKPGTPDGDEFDLLVALIEAYERVAYPIDLPDPIETIRFRMEQDGLNSKVDVDNDPISPSPLIKGDEVGG